MFSKMDSPKSSPICPGGSCNERWTCGEVAPKRRQVHEFAPWARNSIPQTDRSVDSDSRRWNSENYTCRRDQLSSLCDQGLHLCFFAIYCKMNTSNKTTLQESRMRILLWFLFLNQRFLPLCPPATTVMAQELGLATGGGLGRWDWNSVTSGADMCLHHAFFSMNMVRNRACNPSTRKTRQATPFRRCTCPSVCRRLIA